MDQTELMTSKEVADHLRVSERTVTDWAQRGKIPSGKIGGSWRFKKTEIDKWLDDQLSGTARKNRPAIVSLKNVLAPERILMLETARKEEALNRLVNCLSQVPQVKDHRALTEAVFRREKLMSTGIGLGIAVPHVRLASLTEIVMAVGISRQNIEDYESLDGQPVRLIFMIAAGQNQHSEYLRLLSELSKCLKDEYFRQCLLDAPDGKTFFDLLAQEG